jgi:hypothetical protein
MRKGLSAREGDALAQTGLLIVLREGKPLEAAAVGKTDELYFFF